MHTFTCRHMVLHINSSLWCPGWVNDVAESHSALLVMVRSCWCKDRVIIYNEWRLLTSQEFHRDNVLLSLSKVTKPWWSGMTSALLNVNVGTDVMSSPSPHTPQQPSSLHSVSIMSLSFSVCSLNRLSPVCTPELFWPKTRANNTGNNSAKR